VALIPMLATLTLTTLAAPVAGQEPWQFRASRPAKQGFDSQKLDDAAAAIEQLVTDNELRGAVLFVARGRSIVLHEAYGHRDVAGKQAMQKDTLFRMASNTKAITAAAILTLVDQGKVSLDDPVHKWFPAWQDDAAKRINVRQLLTHSSGLRIGSLFMRPLMKKSKEHPDAPNLVLECDRFGTVGAKVEPGTTYSYSNPGYNTLAGIVEVASGMSFAGYCDATFYKPLDMRDTNHHETTADISRMSVVAYRVNKKWRARWAPGDAPTVPFVRGSGGLISTARDYARFCRMVLDSGTSNDQRILSKKTVAAATKNQIRHIKGGRYGFGWRIDPEGFSHSGSDGTFVWCDPERDLIGMVLTQTQRSKKLGPARNQFRKDVSAACVPTERVRKRLR